MTANWCGTGKESRERFVVVDDVARGKGIVYRVVWLKQRWEKR